MPERDTMSDLRTAGASLRLESVRRSYGAVDAVDDVTLDVPSGTFLTLLGASGSGKTTLLRIIAGFDEATSGAVIVDGHDMSGVPVHRRHVGMVFQNYALFPHMSVERNIAFPLARQGVSRTEQRRRVAEALDAVELGTFGRRKPHELSGGQQQRVALARAIVARPRLLLMDEPLGALDRRLRESLQVTIRSLSHDLGLTVINVTHDQQEALTMSDRIALLADGRVQQFGTPYDLYAHPANETVALFLGDSNILRGRAEPDGKDWLLRLGGGDTCVPLPAGAREYARGDHLGVFVRPHAVQVQGATADVAGRAADGRAHIVGIVVSTVYAGDSCRLNVTTSSGDGISVLADPTMLTRFAINDRVEVSWRVDDALVFA